MIIEHEHPLNLIDMWSKHINYEEESDEDDDDGEKDLVRKPDFECECDICEETIFWYHRYYYKCDHCHYSIHKFCQHLPTTTEYHASDIAHTLILSFPPYGSGPSNIWYCNICETDDVFNFKFYYTSAGFNAHIKCATRYLKLNFIHHPSHMHPLASIASGKQILCKCEACGKKHIGLFYQCLVCPSSPLLHNDCVFLPKRLLIQQTTHDRFSHTHPLTLAYSFQKLYIRDYTDPKCRVCNDLNFNEYLWRYECGKCRYYAHLDCATYTSERFMSILIFPGTGKLIKNYEEDDYPDLLHLPFPDESYSILKNLFYKDTRSMSFGTNDVIKKHISHEHPLLVVDVTRPTTASHRAKNVSYHNPRKKIQLLCNGCVKPIMTPPFYVCANEDENCDFVLHEWCTRLPVEVNNHPGHRKHPLIYHPKINPKFLNVFECAICRLPSNGFVYCCVECGYCVDVCCAFIPERVTHKAHPNHLLSIYETGLYYPYKNCRLCMGDCYSGFAFQCEVCDINLHVKCALLVSETITHKVDKHPMKLSYFPIENHKSDYFCEICEFPLDPGRSFYHCQECVQSVHTACAPLIRQSETYTSPFFYQNVDKYVNIKFEVIHNLAHVHQHSLSFVRGIETKGVHCDRCLKSVRDVMTLKCLQCKFAMDYDCFKSYYAR